MKLIKPSYEILEQGSDLEGIYEMIELAGRTCYKSQRPEGKTAKDFVDLMIKNKHHAMLEHGTVYLAIPHNPFSSISDSTFRYRGNPYSKVVNDTPSLPDTVYVTTNLRVLLENDWLDDLQYLCEPTEYHEKRVTVRFTTSNGIMREFTRHKDFCVA